MNSGICCDCGKTTRGRGLRCRHCSQGGRIVKPSSAKKTAAGLRKYYKIHDVWNKNKTKHNNE